MSLDQNANIKLTLLGSIFPYIKPISYRISVPSSDYCGITQPPGSTHAHLTSDCYSHQTTLITGKSQNAIIVPVDRSN